MAWLTVKFLTTELPREQILVDVPCGVIVDADVGCNAKRTYRGLFTL